MFQPVINNEKSCTLDQMELNCIICSNHVEIDECFLGNDFLTTETSILVIDSLQLFSNFEELNIDPSALPLCLTCFQLLETSLSFKYQCDKSVARLKSHLKQQNQHNTKPVINRLNIKVEDTYEEPMIVFVEQNVSGDQIQESLEALDNDLSRFQNQLLTTPSDAENLKCDVCNALCKNISTYKQHIKLNNCNPDKQIKCQHCAKEFKQITDWLSHLKTHKSQGLNDYNQTSNKDETDSNQEDEYIPTSTSDDSDSSQSCNKTSKNAKSTKKYRKCEICNKPLKTLDTYKMHMKYVHGNPDNQLICMYCEKTFFRKEGLIMHLRVHTKEKPYTCKFCGKAFRTNSSVLIHQRMHTGKKLKSCPICQQRFASSSNLKSHMDGHSNGPAFECPFCLAVYKRGQALNRHLQDYCTGILRR